MTVEQRFFRTLAIGRSKLAMGRVCITSTITRESAFQCFGAIHWGDHNISCCISPCPDENTPAEAFVNEVFEVFSRAEFPAALLLLEKTIGTSVYSLRHLFRDEQRRILQLVLESNLSNSEAAYRQVFDTNAPLLLFLKDLNVPAPRALAAAAEYLLNAAIRRAFENPVFDLDAIRQLLDAATMHGVTLDATFLEIAIRGRMEQTAMDFQQLPTEIEALRQLDAITGLLPEFPFEINLRTVQDIYYQCLKQLLPRMQDKISHPEIEAEEWIDPLHSGDVWAHRELFKLDPRHRPLCVSGVPPDYFSADGQLWGHPVYNWKALRKTRYDWWIRRIAHQMAVFDAVRIDHFRGLVAYWEVAAGEITAKRGRWVETPSEDFFSELQRRFVSLPMVAEDLGHITADVRETMQRYGLPGMRVLLFGFSGNPRVNPNAPHNIPEHCVVYTGTHDNNTVRGWFGKEASRSEKHRLSVVSGRSIAAREISWELIRLAMLSPARWAIIPVQDLLGLGAAARMNTPGQSGDNWHWRMTAGQKDALPVKRLLEMATTFGRA